MKALRAARVQELGLLWGLVDRTERMAEAVAERALDRSWCCCSYGPAPQRVRRAAHLPASGRIGRPV